ncbi:MULTISPECIES: hypothetical protein [Arthrobacter]|uniref:hypothetical protein n=1 Tax=Arthrobacter TaxID=1663 RepID=UPI00197ADB36|nr:MULTISPECIES: hypothetical protein [Arthrobacter]MBT8161784.1 DUF1616 domain-containing protein [Arthrobacter sp. GN70]
MASEHSNASKVSALVAATALSAIPLSFAGPQILRLTVIGLFLLAGPGTALILVLNPARIRKGTGIDVIPLAVAIAVSFSLAMAILLATAMLFTGFWYPSAAVCCLAVMTLGALAAAERRFRRTGPVSAVTSQTGRRRSTP